MPSFSVQGLDPLQTQLGSALSGLYQNAQSLLSPARSLNMTQTDSALRSRTATTNNSAVLTATASPDATMKSYQVTVSSLAQAQVNTGTALNATAASSVSAGTNTVAVTVNGQTSNVSYGVNAGDTNQTVLNNLASAINNAGLGLQATVLNDNTAGTVSLQVSSKVTGTQHGFSLNDVSGNTVAQTGINTVTAAAANASYTVDGINYTSQGNKVYLDNSKLTLSLWQTSSNPVTVTVNPDTQAITTAATNLVNQYNNMQRYLNTSGQHIASTFKGEIGQAVTQAPGLGAIGITTNGDGTLSLDQNKLTTAIQTDFASVQQALGGYNGLGTTLANAAQHVLSSPLANFAAPVPFVLTQGLFLNTAL
ncbi:MAG: flagellar filament capping protein FliD [Firmicutes bacterium]|nr:flagellar filament capping protein FliD [Bacillota bacterium]